MKENKLHIIEESDSISKEVWDNTPTKFYRCGWCGFPTDKDGVPSTESGEVINKMIERNTLEEEYTHGLCCCDIPTREKIEVTREMAIDAGDLNLEGTLIDW